MKVSIQETVMIKLVGPFLKIAILSISKLRVIPVKEQRHS